MKAVCSFRPKGRTAQGYRLAGYDKALAAVSDRLSDALGVQAPKLLGPETFSLKTSLSDPNHVIDFVNPATATGKADLARLFGVSFHIYGAGAAGGDNGPNPTQFRTGLHEVRDAYRTGGLDKPLFQNEFLEGDRLTTVAGIISDTFTEGRRARILSGSAPAASSSRAMPWSTTTPATAAWNDGSVSMR